MDKSIEYVPFSQCDLWEQQRDFYLKEDISAWDNKLPFYATSNPYIGRAYAEIIVRYIQDLLNLNQYDKEKPLYIIELGAGIGAFSYYLLKNLVELLGFFNLSDCKFVYVMTDFVSKNVDFWKKQPNLQPYIKQGFLDFSLYDVEKSEEIKLEISKTILNNESIANPLLLIANYVFDTFRHDFFEIKNKKLKIGLVNKHVKIVKKINNGFIAMNEIDPSFHYIDISLPHYGSTTDEGLHNYISNYQNEGFVFPVTAIKCIENFRKLANNRLLVFISDKGYSNNRSGYYRPDVVSHFGAFSISVNFDAIEAYIRSVGGSFYCEETSQDINSALGVFGNSLYELKETYHAASNFLNRFSPGSLLQLHQIIKLNPNETYKLNLILAHLNNACWDDKLFCAWLPMIMNSIQRGYSTELSLKDLIFHCKRIAANFYYLPNAQDSLFDIGYLLQQLNQYEDALGYYKQSVKHFGEQLKTLFNMAMCYYFLSEYKKSVALLNKIIRKNENDVLAVGWLTHINNLKTKKIALV